MTIGVEPAAAVTNGRLLLPANTVSLLSDSIRTAISAPTRLSRSARMRPVKSPMPEMPTSAFGALATMLPSESRTTMSRMRSDVRPLASRSICVPPISTSCPPPRFSLIATVNHGVATSSSIGPLDSRHHNAPTASAARPPSPPLTRASLRRRGHPGGGSSQRRHDARSQSRAHQESGDARGRRTSSEARRLLFAEMAGEAFLQLSERLQAWITVLTRHAPTGVPSTPRTLRSWPRPQRTGPRSRRQLSG